MTSPQSSWPVQAYHQSQLGECGSCFQHCASHEALELMTCISLTAFLASAKSASNCLLARSAESRSALDSSTSPLRALAFLSAIPTASLIC